MKKLDFIFALLVLVITLLFTHYYSGGPLSWDELLYMDLSLNTVKMPIVLNRYFHIYIQKFFIWLSGDTISGVNLYWSFLIAFTLSLIFLSSRILSKQTNYLTSILTIPIFYSQFLIFQNNGVAWCDFTVMAMTMLAVFIYLIYIFTDVKKKEMLLILLGVVFYFAVKSKETAIVLLVLICGFDYVGNNRKEKLISYLNRVKFFISGIAIGVIIIMVLDYFFLNDILFSLRPSNIKSLSTFNFLGEYIREPHSWYHIFGAYSYYSLLIPQILYFITLWQQKDVLSKKELVIWILPLLLVLFLTNTMIYGRWGVIKRYYIPAIPIICILSAQFFSIQLPDIFKKEKITLFFKKKSINIHQFFVYIFLAFSGLVIAFFLERMIFKYINAIKYGWSFEHFFQAIIKANAFSFLLIISLFFKKKSVKTLFLSLICFSLIFIHPIIKNYNHLQKRVGWKKSQERFYPFKVFSEKTKNITNEMIYISKNIYLNYKILGRDKFSSVWMFNIYFNINIDEAQIRYSDDLKSIIVSGAHYAYLTKSELDSTTVKNKNQILNCYEVNYEKTKKFVLLKKK